MDYIGEIKKLLKDIAEKNDKTKKSPTRNIATINDNENPLNSALLSYCFDNILGFTVHYRIFEKINYMIEFDYKGSLGCIVDAKMSLNIRVDKKYKNELIIIFEKCKEILSVLFQDFGEKSIEDNHFTMENSYYKYKEELDFFSNRVFEMEDKKSLLKEKKDKELKNRTLSRESCQAFNEFSCVEYNYEREERYAIEIYIDIFYSFLEHVLTLLYPFTSDFDISKSYAKGKINNSKWTWSKKLVDVSCGNQRLLSYLDDLLEIKEIYRNRITHGMFSRELKIYTSIDGFGRYPIYLGKKYLKGFIEDCSQYNLGFEKFKEIKKIFESFIKDLNEIYPIPMIFIEGGVPIPVEVTILTKGTCDEEEAKCLLEKEYRMIDSEINMDW